jgi:DNA mismatch repair protein MutS
VIDRAKEILDEILARDKTLPETPADETAARPSRAGKKQGNLFAPEDLLIKEILSTDPNMITPLEALTLIFRWRNELDDRDG